MILDQFPDLRKLAKDEQCQLAAELLDMVLDSEVALPPELLAAVQERVSFNEAHLESSFSSAEMNARMARLKHQIAARQAHA
jgi:hypothetical protein